MLQCPWEFSRQEYWSGLPCPPPKDPPKPGLNLGLPHCRWILYHLNQQGSLSSSLVSTIRVIPSTYLRLLIFLTAILILAWDASTSAFHMMYSAYELNKQDDNTEPCHSPFPVLNQSIVPCPILTVAFRLAYKFLRRQVRWSSTPISLRTLQFVVIYLGFPCGSTGKESTCNVGDLSSIPG